MTFKNCILVGAPVDSGKARKGCVMGPDAYRTAGISEMIRELGHTIDDRGNFSPDTPKIPPDADQLTRDHLTTIGWTKTLSAAANQAARVGFPIFLGGDHALSLGTVAGMAKYAQDIDKPLFVLWLDAHTDYHTPKTSTSGNLHGTPLGYVTGRDGFDAFPPLPAIVPEDNICLIGLRSVDSAEAEALAKSEMHPVDMRRIDEVGIAAPLAAFLEKVKAANGILHVSLDVDFLDPAIAPAVGTTVPGGATFREAHLVMEMLHDAGCVAALDLVELNPFLDERGKTASLMVDLTASLLGKRVFDRPTGQF
ncbi:arginase [Halocynthiibacter namhaensis]|uniref:arginase n=1 Tax=Halocynthiibacter namhaensis TaxID=1290553 RepID=UPI0005797F2F|nr:arginase [Halocynthiibacter namhaensis]